MALPNLRFVQIQTHTRCQADCLFCPYVESAHAEQPGVMPERLWLKILDDLEPFRQSLINGKILPYLMQEPLLDRTIFTKIHQIYERFPRTFVELSTNGGALTPRVVDRLLEVLDGRRHAVWVSHHGVDQTTFQHIMKLDFQRAERNLIHFLKRAEGKFRIIIRGAGQSRAGDTTFFTRETYLDYWCKLFDRHHINTAKVHVDAFTFHDRAGTLHRTDRGADKLNLGNIRQIGPGFPPFQCPRLDQWLHVMHDGTVRLCCMDYHGEVQLPNLNHMTIVEYFQSDAYRRLADQVTGQADSPQDFICKRCISPGG